MKTEKEKSNKTGTKLFGKAERQPEKGGGSAGKNRETEQKMTEIKKKNRGRQRTGRAGNKEKIKGKCKYAEEWTANEK
jgi:hypothetical protein